MSLTKILLAYFNFIAVIFGAFDFVLDRKNKLIKSSWVLAIYSKIICILFLLSCPLYMHTLVFTITYDEFPMLIKVMWSIEYTSLIIMTGLFYFAVTINKKTIQNLIIEGFCISKDARGKVQKATDKGTEEYEHKSLKIFSIKFIIDHIVLTSGMIVFSQTILQLQARILALICFLMSFISYFITNSFIFIMLLIQYKFRAINRNMKADIMHEDNLSFAQDVQAHRTLRFFCEKIVKVFSKIFIANFLYQFATTLSSVSQKFHIWQ